MATAFDYRRLRNVALVCAALIFIAAGLGLFRNAPGGVWLAAGALAASLAMLATVWRLAALAQEWGRELRTARGDLNRISSQLAAQQQQLNALTAGMDLAFFICGQDGTIQYANVAAKRLFNFDEPVGRTLLAVTLSYDLHRFVSEKCLSRKLAEPVRTEIDLSYPEPRSVMASAWRIPGADRALVTLRDISELQRLKTVRADFVANVSHEFRTPMATVRAMAETILDDKKTPLETRERYLQKIIAEIDRLTEISEDLLVLSAAESQPVEKQPVDLAEVVRYVVQQTEPQAKERGLKMGVELPQSLHIQGNRNQLVQVVMNLLSNAIRYTPKGSIEVKLSAEDGQAVCEFRDTGIGIASEHLPRIFERFYRVDKARSRETGGTGLGLSIVRHIVEAHGGKVEVESELNVGSSFRVSLPSC